MDRIINFLPLHLPINLNVIPIPYKIHTAKVPINLGSVYENPPGNACGSQIIPIKMAIVSRTKPIMAE